jgi:hypothetical protein
LCLFSQNGRTSPPTKRGRKGLPSTTCHLRGGGGFSMDLKKHSFDHVIWTVFPHAIAVPSTFFHVMPLLLYIWLRCYMSTPIIFTQLSLCSPKPCDSASLSLFTTFSLHDTISTLYSRLFFFRTTVCFFCLWRLWRDTPNSRPSPYADFLTQRQHFIIFMLPLQGFILMALKILSVSADTTLLYRALSLSVYCSERLGLV